MPSAVVIGTRASKLALIQAEMVRAALASAHPDVEVAIEHISTAGDRIQDRPIEAIGSKALFVAEIEAALRSGRIQVAVHSAKDIPSDLPKDTCIAAYLPRADARDVVVSPGGLVLTELPPGARVGTSSPRRASQLRAHHPHLDPVDIRGNVDARLQKVEDGQYDAIILAAAGVVRLGLDSVITQFLSLDDVIPCGGQGAIAMESYAGDAFTLELLAPLNHVPTSDAVTAERAFLARVGGSCSAPLGVHARIVGNALHLAAMIGSADGRSVTECRSGSIHDGALLGIQLADSMLANGGTELLANDGFIVARSG